MFLWIPNTHQKFGNTLKLRKYINALVFLKHVFQKEEQEQKGKRFYISKPVPKILIKHSKNKYICVYYKIDKANKNT